MPAFDQQGK